MLDRASCFASPEILELLKSSYVPVALDVWYEQRRKDVAGELYKQIVTQRDGLDDAYAKDKTTQGFYISTPNGHLLRGWNNRDTAKVERFLRESLAEPRDSESPEPAVAAQDKTFTRELPKGGQVVDVFTKITDAKWPDSKDPKWDPIFRRALGRDHLWILAAECDELRVGRMPQSLAQRIARYHLIDNTRGEPPMWQKSEVKTCDLVIERLGDGRFRVTGTVKLATRSGDRGYDAALSGEIEFKDQRLARFDFVARGSHHGHGQFTPRAPEGSFTLAIAFAIGIDASVPPQGARDLRDYLGR